MHVQIRQTQRTLLKWLQKALVESLLCTNSSCGNWCAIADIQMHLKKQFSKRLADEKKAETDGFTLNEDGRHTLFEVHVNLAFDEFDGSSLRGILLRVMWFSKFVFNEQVSVEVFNSCGVLAPGIVSA